MSGKSEKKLRRAVNKQIKKHDLTERQRQSVVAKDLMAKLWTAPFKDRFAISMKLLFHKRSKEQKGVSGV